jgi:hypothetical protein
MSAQRILTVGAVICAVMGAIVELCMFGHHTNDDMIWHGYSLLAVTPLFSMIFCSQATKQKIKIVLIGIECLVLGLFLLMWFA